MFQTRVAQMFGIQYPIIQGGLSWLSTAELATAVSNAGGLGIIIAVAFPTAQELRREIQKAKSLTDKPFGVNITLIPGKGPQNPEAYIEVVIEEGVRMVETAGRLPEAYMKRLKEGGVKVMHKVARVRDARAVEHAGADAVCIVGFEGAGNPGMDNVTSLIRIPLAVDALKIPLIAAGGIGDARGFVAALALGAEGILMGTRFMTTQESPLHPRVKQWLVEAQQMDTLIIGRSTRNVSRCMRNELTEKVLEMEARDATAEELGQVINAERVKRGLLEGDIDAGLISCGQVVGLIKETLSVKEVIDSIIDGAKTIGEGLYSLSRQEG
jgi:nitronate monooxygenase